MRCLFRTISYKVIKEPQYLFELLIIIVNFNYFRCALDIHFRTHKGEKFFKCVLCDNIFNELATLKQHRELHNINELVTCGICGLVFTEMYQMIIHKKKCHFKEK